MARIALFLISWLAPLAFIFAAGNERLDAIRTFAEHAETLELSIGSAAPKYQVVRLNGARYEHEGRRYGLVKVKLPPDGPYTFVMLFADVGNIAEYEIMPAAPGSEPIRGYTRLILPPLTDDEHEAEHGLADLTLPKPWDHFELHLLGFDHERLTYRYAGRDFRLTDVHGKVLHEIIV